MRRAFILYKNALFASGLEKLLREKGVDVVGLGLYTRKGLEQITLLSPDFVVAEVEKEESEVDTLLSQILRDQRSAQVVRVSLEDNSVTLYTGNRWTANTMEELLSGVISSTAGTKPAHRKAHA